jgi:hypothetical protein
MERWREGSNGRESGKKERENEELADKSQNSSAL